MFDTSGRWVAHPRRRWLEIYRRTNGGTVALGFGMTETSGGYASVASGEAGELVVKRTLVFEGGLNQPDATPECR